MEAMGTGMATLLRGMMMMRMPEIGLRL